jgi:hypothetical protein
MYSHSFPKKALQIFVVTSIFFGGTLDAYAYILPVIRNTTVSPTINNQSAIFSIELNPYNATWESPCFQTPTEVIAVLDGGPQVWLPGPSGYIGLDPAVWYPLSHDFGVLSAGSHTIQISVFSSGYSGTSGFASYCLLNFGAYNFTVADSSLPPTNGVCSSPPIHYSCALGASTNQQQTSFLGTDVYTWTCSGINGGSAAVCDEWKVLDPPNTPPSTPTVTPQPFTGSINTSYPFAFTSFDPDFTNHVSFEVDWNNDGLPDQTTGSLWSNALPVTQTLNNPSTQWSAVGTYTFQVRAKDDKGGISAWARPSVTLNATPAGTLTASPSICYIASGASTCTGTLTWSTANTTAPAVVNRNTGTTLSTLANNATPLTVAVPYLGSAFELRDGSTILDTKSILGLCASDSTWYVSSCVPRVAIGTFTAPSPIPYNTPATLSWTGVTGPGTITCSIDQGIGAVVPPGTIPSGSVVTGNLIMSTTFTLTCGSGIGPNARKSVTVMVTGSPPSGTLTPSAYSCLIAIGASTCTVRMNWSTLDTTAPALVNRNTGAILSTLANNTFFAVSVSNPTTTFDLKDGSTLLDTETISGSCRAGYTWNGTICLANVAIGTLTAPSPISNNTPATLSWTGVTGGGTITCTIDEGVGVVVPPGVIPSGSVSTGNLTTSTAFTLTCGNGVGPNATKSVAVAVGGWVPSGVLSPSSITCSIPAGFATCSITFTWATANTTAPALINRDTGTTLSTIANMTTPFTVSIPNATATFDLKNGATILDSAAITGSCAAGTTWSGTRCATVPGVTLPTATSITATGATLGATVNSNGGAVLTARGTCWGTTPAPTSNCLGLSFVSTGIFTHARTGLPAGTTIYYRGYATNAIGTGYSVDGSFTTLVGPTGTLTPAASIPATLSPYTASPVGCTIAIGASTCVISFTWTSSNTVSTVALYDTNAPVRNLTGATSIPSQSSGFNVWVSNPTTGFELRDGATVLASRTVNGTCAANSTWNGTLCLANVAIGTFTASPSSIPNNTSTTLTSSGVTGGGTITCSINPAVVGPVSPNGSNGTGNLTTDTTFTLTCSNGVGPDATKTTTVTVAAGIPILTVDPVSHALGFGDVPVNSTKDMSFTVRNTGAVGSILNGTATLDPSPYFTCVSGCGAYTLDTITSQTVTIRFTTGATPFNGAVTQITFTGANTSPASSITGDIFGNAIIPLSGTSLNFGNVVKGKSKTLVLTLTNSGTSDIITTLGLPSSVYTCATNCTNFTIPANGGTYDITIRFAPTAVQTYNGNATLVGYPTLTFPITGAGVQGTFQFIEQ